MHPEHAGVEHTPVSNASNSDATNDHWSAQLRAASHTTPREQVTSLAAAKEGLAAALMSLRSDEQTLQELKQLYESIIGMLYTGFMLWLLGSANMYLMPL